MTSFPAFKREDMKIRILFSLGKKQYLKKQYFTRWARSLNIVFTTQKNSYLRAAV